MDLKAFKAKYIYNQPERINYIPFNISQLLFKVTIDNFLGIFDLKHYYY